MKRWTPADAMLRERERVTEPLQKEKQAEVSAAPVSRPPETRASFSATNHDAAPAATARTDADRDRTDKAAARPGEGTGDIPCSRAREIAAWAVYVNGEYDSSYGPDAIDEALEIAADCSGDVVPLYRTPQTNATPGEGSVQSGGTLTDEEREAIEEAMRQVVESDCIATPHALEVIDTLRGLLERLA
jgi:hypothetical protein